MSNAGRATTAGSEGTTRPALDEASRTWEPAEDRGTLGSDGGSRSSPECPVTRKRSSRSHPQPAMAAIGHSTFAVYAARSSASSQASRMAWISSGLGWPRASRNKPVCRDRHNQRDPLGQPRPEDDLGYLQI